MKKLLYYLVATLMLASCQKQNYVSSIPAPKFEYHASAPKPIALPSLEASTTNTPTDAVVLPTVTGSGSALSTETVESLSTTSNAITKKATKSSLKQRIVGRVVERKMRKMSSQQNTSPQARKTDGVSVASFIAAVLGIVGLFATGWLFLLGMIAAIVLGFVGLSRVKHSNGQLGGRGWAISGLVLGFLELLLLILGVLFVAALISSFGA